eukprot:4731480-Karenia_brevis.AAC.1
MSTESSRARKSLREAHEEFRRRVDTFSRDPDQELISHQREIKEVHTRNRRLAEILSSPRRAIDKELD